MGGGLAQGEGGLPGEGWLYSKVWTECYWFLSRLWHLDGRLRDHQQVPVAWSRGELEACVGACVLMGS